MNLGIIIQARMSSRRLPGKVLRPIAGRPLLGYLLDRLGRSVDHPPLLVATSDRAEDDPVVAFCDFRGVPCFRGDLHDVASRFASAADAHGLDAFVRVNGDSPLLDPRLVDHAIALFREGGHDLVTNVFPRSYPPGQSVEVVSTSAFARGRALMSGPDDAEHVTRVFYRLPEDFAIRNFSTTADHRGAHLAVDTEEHLETLQKIVALMSRPHWEYGVEEVERLYHAARGGPAGEAA